MKKLVLVLVVVLLASMVAMAQEEKAQVFGGWQYTSVGFPGDRVNTAKGWDADLAIKATKNFAIVADVSGAYKSESVTVEGVTAKADAKLHTFLFGPRFSANSGKVSPFVEGLFGIAHLSASGSVDGFGGVSGSTNAFAMGFGGGLDVHASKTIAIRLAKFDYVLARKDGTNINNIRIASGIVFKF